MEMYDRHRNAITVGDRVKYGTIIGKIIDIKIAGFGVVLSSQYRKITVLLDDLQKVVPEEDRIVGLELDGAQANSLVGDMSPTEIFKIDSIPVHYELKVATNLINSIKVSSFGESGIFQVDKSVNTYKNFRVGDKIRWGVWGEQFIGTIKEIFADGSANVKLSFFKSSLIHLAFDYAIRLDNTTPERFDF